ncbi:MAG: right-handed parallel beta-helix repeat-containing protein, partial [bacterium]|nr:right-handed parallel beta-helix repeat-containing protein [bacterium]
EFALACRVAYNQGVDLYGLADNRLALGFEYTAKYLLGEKVSAYGPISEQGRDRVSDIYESVYQQYHFVRGLEMPYLAQIIEETLVGRRSGRALTFHQGPLPDMKVKRTHGPKPGDRAVGAGAQNKVQVQPPDTAIRIGPSDDLQAALNACTEGSWVVLDAGIFTLNDTLKIPSGITLSGQGLGTILFLHPDSTGPALVNATVDLRDVVLRDFVVEGATTTETPDDPNSRRRRQSYQHAPSRAGIVFSADQPGQMKNIQFEHITVQNCAHDGVAIRGASQVVLTGCDFSDNGGSVVPGPGLQHNLLISRSDAIEIRSGRFDTSPSGSGIDISHCQDVTLSDNEVARNACSGIRVTESENIHIENNLTEGNDAHGIALDTLMDGCRQVTLIGNTSRNNGRSGIHTKGTRKLTAKQNIETDNKGD